MIWLYDMKQSKVMHEIKEAVRYLKVYVAQWRIMMSENLQFFKVVPAPAVQDEIRKMGSIHHLKENSTKALRLFNYVSETTTRIPL